MPKDQSKPSQGFSPLVLGAVVGVVCACLAVSAFYTYATLAALRKAFLENMGHHVSMAIDQQMRGPGVRNNPDAWQVALAEFKRSDGEPTVFLALADPRGRLRAWAGDGGRPLADRAAVRARFKGRGFYLIESPLGVPSHAPRGTPPHMSGWSLLVVLDASPAAFIMTRAHILLAVSLAAIAVLAAAAFLYHRSTSRLVAVRAREERERHLARLGSMSAMLAHEIRNPLGAMKGLTQVVREDIPKDHGSQALLQTVVTEAERLEGLVSDLLAFARPKQPEMGTFDLRTLLEDIKAMLAPKLAALHADLDITIEAPMAVTSDERGLRQVLLNVVLNAAEACAGQGTVTVKGAMTAGGRWAVIDVLDEGPGLEGRSPESLFEPFATGKLRGTGLGLAVSRQIMERLGGEIRLADLPEGGAICTLRIPTGRA